MTKEKRKTLNEWKDFGNRVKKIRDELGTLSCEPNVKKGMMKHLTTTIKNYNRFISDCENEMFDQGFDNMKIFYGALEYPENQNTIPVKEKPSYLFD